MKRILGFFLMMSGVMQGQIPAPQINLSGNIGCQGFPCINSVTLIMTTDANRTMTALETSAMYIKVTSSVALTDTRNLIAPAGRFNFTIENATTGGQAIQIIGVSGTGITIPNGNTASVWNDGTNLVGTNTLTSVTGTAPVDCTTSGSSVNCAMAQATSSVDGYLSQIDWTTFNNKQPAGTYLTPSSTVFNSVNYPSSYSQYALLTAPTTASVGSLLPSSWTTTRCTCPRTQVGRMKD